MSKSKISGLVAAEFIQNYCTSDDTLRAELSAGLLAAQAVTSPKFLYDALGSKLFEAICELPEYYPTRTEADIFKTNLSAIAKTAGMGGTLIDLGAGNCVKAARLFAALQPAQYVPVDVSVEFLRDAVSQLKQRYPHIEMTGLGLDFSSTLELPEAVSKNKRLFFYPGSSIGNFTPEDALAFFQRLRAACNTDGGLLIGVDLIKDKPLLDAAYDDALGVTAAFNLNLLLHLNHMLGADFNVREWRHIGFYNTEKNRIEMYLEARSDLTVTWTGASRRFTQGERIHTENSYKYTPEMFLSLLTQAGFGEAKLWSDANKWFAVIHARAV